VGEEDYITYNKDGLQKIVGGENVIDDPKTLEDYSRDESFVHPMMPQCVVKPKNSQEVREVVQWANRTGAPLLPVSSGPPHFHGDTVPGAAGATIVDLSEMRRIISIDRRNRLVVIEPGVTYDQLQPELAKEGLRLASTLVPRANKSVIASLLEREPRLAPRYQWSALDPLRCTEIIWGDGQRMTTGNAEATGSLEEERKKGLAPFMAAGPAQTDFYRMVSGAQGSMGMVTYASIKCEVLPQIHKLFFVSSDKPDDLIDFVYRLLRFRFGDELLLLNSFNLACILENSADKIMKLTGELPPWLVLVGIAGRDRLPRERVEFQKKDISDIARQFDLKLVQEISGAKSNKILEAILRPSRVPYWKLDYKGGCQDIFFVTTLEKTSEFTRTMYSVAEAQGYPVSEIGVYVQPMHQGASCHCEFNLPFNRDNPREVTRMQYLYANASEELLRKGAFFSRPYGIWADMAFNRDAQTTIALKKVKKIFDPNNVMNPGKLCF
jgi:FAD/FMN-containing dehydrogenase